MRPPKIRAFGLDPDELVIDLFAGGVALAGNSVSPPVAEALVRANVYERHVHAA